MLLEKMLQSQGFGSRKHCQQLIKNGAVYFAAIGGAAALMAKCVKSAEIITYEDLGAEAIRKLEVEDLPLVVVIDSEGNNLYEIGKEAYLNSLR